jgi:hypothetical protein
VTRWHDTCFVIATLMWAVAGRSVVRSEGIRSTPNRRLWVAFRSQRGGDEMIDALLIPIAAVGTGVVVIVVAIAVVLVVLFVTLSMRGRQRRGVKRRDETRHELAETHERAARAEHDRDIAQEQAQQQSDPDR